MPKISSPKHHLYRLKRSSQINGAFCGPAVIQMLLSSHKIKVSQPDIARAAHATRSIKKYGMRIDQMKHAVKEIAPRMQFWYKNKATLGDLIFLTDQLGYPVGVEWQGVFTHHLLGEEAVDPGHYSIVMRIHKKIDKIAIADPYINFAHRNRVLSLKRFMKLWWDTNEIPRGEGKKPMVRHDVHTLFILADKKMTFPKSLGLVR